MSNKQPIFIDIPVGGMVTHRHLKFKFPRIVSIRLQGRKVVASLSCGHESVLFTVPKHRTICYDCHAESIDTLKPAFGYRRVVVPKTIQ